VVFSQVCRMGLEGRSEIKKTGEAETVERGGRELDPPKQSRLGRPTEFDFGGPGLGELAPVSRERDTGASAAASRMAPDPTAFIETVRLPAQPAAPSADRGADVLRDIRAHGPNSIEFRWALDGVGQAEDPRQVAAVLMEKLPLAH
jgi:hypothetical protein